MPVGNVKEKIAYAFFDTLPVVLGKFDSSNLFYNQNFLSLVLIFPNSALTPFPPLSLVS